MNYQEYKPAPILEKYIDAYWTVTTGGNYQPAPSRIIPDTCADIIINLGSTVAANNDNDAVLKADGCYLVGTMTKFADSLIGADALLVGTRFKPFALNALLGFPLSGATDKIFELSNADFAFKKFISSKKIGDLQNAFNNYFGNLLQTGGNSALNILESIHQSKGVITVTELAAKHFTTDRQLERLCEQKIGITIKELCKLVRFKYTVELLEQKGRCQSIDAIAFETGYYDHSHLSKEIKRYTGYNPTHYFQ